MQEFNSINQLISRSETEQKSIADIMIAQEMETSGLSYDDIYKQMEYNLDTMENAVKEGLEGVESTTGLTGGDAVKMRRYIESGRGLSGDLTLHAIMNAVSTN